MKKLRRITRQLKARRKALLENYDEEALHQLRVAIRRIRGLLKQHRAQEARELRKAMGRLARRTNAARDWDTFALFARQSLENASWQALQPSLQCRQVAAREEALDMLASREWTTTFRRWTRYLKHEGEISLSKPAVPAAIDTVREQAALAKEKALASGEDGDWHAFRIAIKDLRYHLDSLDPETVDEQRSLKRALKLCKKLQDSLGCWHDTAVHRKLLAELAGPGPERASDEGAVRAIAALDKAIRARGEACLDSARKTLAARPGLLQAEGGEAWQWGRR